MVERSLLVKAGIAVAVVAAVVLGGFLLVFGANFQQPTVVAINNSFGEVTQSSAVIDSRVVVENPNEEPIPGTVTITYTVKLNDVTVATGRRSGVKLQPGRNVIDLRTRMNNSKIPMWWVSHVRRSENTTLQILPRVSYSGVPLGSTLALRTSQIRTRMLGPLDPENTTTVVAGNRTLLTVSDRNATWGEVTAERTPIWVTSTLRNRHDAPVRIDGTVYEIRMNGVVVGQGRTNDSFVVAPGESIAYNTTATIDASEMQDWWVSHLQAGQRTELTVEVFGMVEDDGELVRVPIAMFRQRSRVTTDMLRSGNGSVEPLPLESEPPTLHQPTTGRPDSDWGEVGEETTEIVTSVPVDNPNGERISRLIDVRASHTTTINGIEVASGTETTENLPPGESTVTVSSTMAHDTVPRWWARHINNGERSTVNTTADGTADVGVTTFDVAIDPADTVLNTSVLAGYNTTEDQSVEGLGRSLVTVDRTTAVWGHATPAEAPIEMTVVLENNQPGEVTIRDINYTATLNGVVLADQELDRTITLSAFERETVTLELTLDNSKMAAWWPTHVRNGERSQLRSESWATVEFGGNSDRVKFDAFGEERTVTTSVLVDRDEDE